MRKNFIKSYFSIIILISILFLPAISSASELELDYPEFGGYDLDEIWEREGKIDLNQLIAWFYYFIVGIAGLAAFTMLVWGGVQWLTSAGNPSKITSAKDRLTSALLGLLIILGSWLILQVINPDLTTLTLPGLPGVAGQERGGPGPQEMGEAPAGCNFVLDEEGNPTKEWECPVKPCIGNWPCENEELLGRVWIDIALYTVCCEEGREGTSEDCPYLVGDERVCTWNDFNVEYYNEEYLCCRGEIEEGEKCQGVFSDITDCRIVEAASCNFPEPPYSPCDPETEEMDDPAPQCRQGADGVGCWQCCLK